MTTGDKQTFEIEKREDGVAVVRMDVPGEPVNTLKISFMDEFARLFEELDRDGALKAVVFMSGKPDSFIAGADITMLQAANTAAEATELSRKGQEALERLEKFRVPVVAAIHGVCLGGGLEVALACDARIASDADVTKLGLPEVQLGLLPGAGGTQRLPRLVGIQAALDLLLTGRRLDAKRAKRLGLVDEVCPAAILEQVAVEHALALTKARRKPLSARLMEFLSQEKLQELGLERNPLGRSLVFSQATKALLEKTHGNYPGPERILEVVRIGLEKGHQAGLEAEARAFGELVVSPQAEQLMGIYFATTALKKDSGTDDPAAEARKVHKVGMLGGGLMGSGIAYVTAAFAATPVRIKDKDHAGVGRGLAAVRKLLDDRVKRRRLSPLERDRVMSLVSGTTDTSGFRRCEVVIEAVFEDLALKHRMLEEIEQVGREDVIFASNTSSLPITKIAEASKHPETVIGMHYFSPVDKMPLLEVIVTEKTAPWVTATCVALGKAQGKTVIVVRDGVGFYTTRVLGPLMNEAAHLVAEGIPVEAVDRAMVQFGWPVGPVTLLDEVGIDVGEKVGHILHEAFGDRLSPPPGVEKLVADGRLGRKNQRGFYLYGEGVKKGKKEVDASVYRVLGIEPTRHDADPEEIAQRCTLQMVNEAARCFGEGILRSARDGDIGAIFGLGFPPFLGGPFHYCDSLGAREVLDRLRRFEQVHGERFEPAPLLIEMAEQGLSFYGEKKVQPGRVAAAV